MAHLRLLALVRLPVLRGNHARLRERDGVQHLASHHAVLHHARQKRKVLLAPPVLLVLEHVRDRVLDGIGIHRAGMVLVDRLDRHSLQLQHHVPLDARHLRRRRLDSANEARVGIVKDDQVHELSVHLLVEAKLYLRKIVDPASRLQQFEAGSHRKALGEVTPNLMSARHDLVVDEKPRQRAERRKHKRPPHDREQVHAASTHRGDLAVRRQAREHKDRRNQQPDRNRPLHRLREAHQREPPDELKRDAVQDVAHDLHEQSDRQHEGQHEKRQQEGREERPEHVSLERLHRPASCGRAALPSNFLSMRKLYHIPSDAARQRLAFHASASV